MQRITRRNGTFSENQNKPAVLLMHGLLCSAMDFVNMGPNKSLGLILADSGFDVWLGNNRGTTWSRQHTTLDPDTDAKFWDFSYETCGYYDLPAKIDYILQKTGQQKIFYVGHSQGTTQFFAMAALRPEYNEKIVLMTALAPVVYTNHISSLLFRTFAKHLSIFELLSYVFNIHELLPHSQLVADVSMKLCSDGSRFQEMCAILLFEISGYDSPQLDRSFLPVITSNTPAGISIKMLVHFFQGINSGQFRRYDYGALNIAHYKSLEPPEFDISAITAPVAVYYAENDYLTAAQDVERFSDELPNLVKKRLIENKKFTHLDFLWAKDVNKIVNADVLEHMKQYVNQSNKANSGVNEKFIPILIILFIHIIGYF
ncbi:unnamed protein product [Phyllotreta striolata]|nr:unnamed protein product [Phyllotreta striolata]